MKYLNQVSHLDVAGCMNKLAEAERKQEISQIQDQNLY